MSTLNSQEEIPSFVYVMQDIQYHLNFPATINEIAKRHDINWRTARNYLELLYGFDCIDKKDGLYAPRGWE